MELKINNNEISLNKFTREFLKNTLNGMISTLKTDSKIKIITIEINKNVKLIINNEKVAINEFVQKLMKESIYGMIKSLKTKDEAIESISIKIKN